MLCCYCHEFRISKSRQILIFWIKMFFVQIPHTTKSKGAVISVFETFYWNHCVLYQFGIYTWYFTEFAGYCIYLIVSVTCYCYVCVSVKLCDTYPRYIYIPATAPTPIVLSSARFRSRGRLPVLSYLHRDNQVRSFAFAPILFHLHRNNQVMSFVFILVTYLFCLLFCDVYFSIITRKK